MSRDTAQFRTVGIVIATMLLATGCAHSTTTPPAPASTQPIAAEETPEQTLRALHAAAKSGDVHGVRCRLTGADDAYLDGMAELWVAIKRLDTAVEARFAPQHTAPRADDAKPLVAETLTGGNVIIRLNDDCIAFFARREGRWKMFAQDPLSESWLTAELIPELRHAIQAYDQTSREVTAGQYASPADVFDALKARRERE